MVGIRNMSSTIAIGFSLFADGVEFGFAIAGSVMVRAFKIIVVDAMSIATCDEIHLAS